MTNLEKAKITNRNTTKNINEKGFIMSRIGKIARLPHEVRDTLNERLQDGEVGRELVDWLNGLPEVKRVLDEKFGGRPISEQNLSDWRKGGYVDWERHQESLGLVESLAEQCTELDEGADGMEVSDRLAVVVAAELARAVKSMLSEAADPEKHWEGLEKAVKLLTALRRGDHRARRVAMQREQWEQEKVERERAEEERLFQDEKDRQLAPLRAALQRKALGPVLGKKLANVLTELKYPLVTGSPGRKRGKRAGKAPTAKVL